MDNLKRLFEKAAREYDTQNLNIRFGEDKKMIIGREWIDKPDGEGILWGFYNYTKNNFCVEAVTDMNVPRGFIMCDLVRSKWYHIGRNSDAAQWRRQDWVVNEYTDFNNGGRTRRNIIHMQSGHAYGTSGKMWLMFKFKN